MRIGEYLMSDLADDYLFYVLGVLISATEDSYGANCLDMERNDLVRSLKVRPTPVSEFRKLNPHSSGHFTL